MALMAPLRSATLSKGSEWFEISDEDTASTTQYYGYLNTSGAWIIQKYDSVAGTYRYFQGKDSYSTNWGNRASLTPYGLYSTLYTII